MSETDRAKRTPPVDIRKLTLTDFRNYRSLSLDLEPGAVVLCGENGAGKTNLLEAVSLFSPGRGLRRAAYAEMAREGASAEDMALALASRLRRLEAIRAFATRMMERPQLGRDVFARGLPEPIAEVKKLIPGKPIKYLVNTHSHIDHSSGLRAFVAEGSTILTYQTNKAYLEKTLSLPHTLNPDKAQQAGKKPVVEGVGEKRVLTDGTHTVELYHMQNFGHHDGMLIVYLPKEKVLLEADGYNPQAATATPPNPVSPYTASLFDNIQRLKLDVQRIGGRRSHLYERRDAHPDTTEVDIGTWRVRLDAQRDRCWHDRRRLLGGGPHRL